MCVSVLVTVASAAVTYVNTAAITATTSAADNAPSSDNSAECGVSCRLAVGGTAVLVVIGIVAVITGLIIKSKVKAKEGTEGSEVSSEAPMPQQECTALAMESTVKSQLRADPAPQAQSGTATMESSAVKPQLGDHDLSLRDYE